MVVDKNGCGCGRICLCAIFKATIIIFELDLIAEFLCTKKFKSYPGRMPIRVPK
jgi:hypothetical protein